MKELFFELIQVSIGIRGYLSRIPTSQEWHALYDMVEMQSLVGVCFVGVQNLGADAEEGFNRIGLPENLYLSWMGYAALIQHRNEEINRQCAQLQEQLVSDGMSCCILKGQGVAQFYGGYLCNFRQCGDIDIWVQNKNAKDLVEYCRLMNVDYKATYAHVSFRPSGGTEVELHPVPTFSRCFIKNRRLKIWFDCFDIRTFPASNGLVIPPLEFNLVYMMAHMYHHIFYDGLGLRQVMDYYYILLSDVCDSKKQTAVETLSELGMSRFVSGIMWIMKEVFDLPENMSLCKENENVGKMLLDEIMRRGSFGFYDEDKNQHCRDSASCRMLDRIKRNMQYFTLGPLEVLCSPLWSVWHWVWRKRNGL